MKETKMSKKHKLLREPTAHIDISSSLSLLPFPLLISKTCHQRKAIQQYNNFAIAIYMKARPLISVLMPVRNTAGFLVEAIESIRSQTYTNWELICVDDASTDGSRLILEGYAASDPRIKVLKNSKRGGISYSLNRALRKAKGDLIARMDADDISLPNRFKDQIKLLRENPGIVACGGQAAMIDPYGKIFAYKKFPTDSDELREMIMRMVPIQHPILMAKGDVMRQYRYKEGLATAEDVDMLFYLISRGPISNVKTLVYKYRKSDLSNGYHNVKKTFLITFAARFTAMTAYGYKPSVKGLVASLLQLIVVSTLPSKFVVRMFEAFRLEPPIWKRPIIAFQSLSEAIASLPRLVVALLPSAR